MVRCPSCGAELNLLMAHATLEKTAQNKPTIEDVKAEFSKEMLEELEILETPDGICVKAKEYWRGASGKAKWNGINELLKQKFGAEWKPMGKDSHWKIG